MTGLDKKVHQLGSGSRSSSWLASKRASKKMEAGGDSAIHLGILGRFLTFRYLLEVDLVVLRSCFIEFVVAIVEVGGAGLESEEVSGKGKVREQFHSSLTSMAWSKHGWSAQFGGGGWLNKGANVKKEKRKGTMSLKSQKCHCPNLKTMKTSFYRSQYFRRCGAHFLKLKMRITNQTCFL